MGWKFHVVPTPKLFQPVSIPKQNIFTFFPALLTIIVPPLRRAELSLTFGWLKQALPLKSCLLGSGMRINRDKTWTQHREEVLDGKGWDWARAGCTWNNPEPGICRFGIPFDVRVSWRVSWALLGLVWIPKGWREERSGTFLPWVIKGSSRISLCPCFVLPFMHWHQQQGRISSRNRDWMYSFLIFGTGSKNFWFSLSFPSNYLCTSELFLRTNLKSVALFKKFLCYINSKARSCLEIKIKFIPFLSLIMVKKILISATLSFLSRLSVHTTIVPQNKPKISCSLLKKFSTLPFVHFTSIARQGSIQKSRLNLFLSYLW